MTKDDIKEFIKRVEKEEAEKLKLLPPAQREKQEREGREWAKFSKIQRESDWWTGFKAYLTFAQNCGYYISVTSFTVPKHLYGSIIDLYDRDGKYCAKFLDSEQNVATFQIVGASFVHSFFDGWLYHVSLIDAKGEARRLDIRVTDQPPHVGLSYEELNARRIARFERPTPTTMVAPMVKNTGDFGGSLRDIIMSNPISELAAAGDSFLKEENTATPHKRDIFLEMITRLKP